MQIVIVLQEYKVGGIIITILWIENYLSLSPERKTAGSFVVTLWVENCGVGQANLVFTFMKWSMYPN